MCFGRFGAGYSGIGGFGAGPWMFGMMAIRLVILAAFIIIGIRLFKGFFRNADPAVKILNERYAKGEISEEDYMTKKQALIRKN